MISLLQKKLSPLARASSFKDFRYIQDRLHMHVNYNAPVVINCVPGSTQISILLTYCLMYFLLKTKIPMVINEPTIFRRIHFKTVILIMTALFRKVLSLSVARDSADTPYFLLKRLYSTYLGSI